MSAAILTIGEELISGKTLDTNGAWLSRQLAARGVRVQEVVTVGDDSDMIVTALKRLDGRYDTVICTGGLGPTHDDITKKAFCRYFKSDLHFDDDYWGALVERFRRRGVVIADNNRSQAEIPDKAEKIRNPVGSALGLKFRSPKTEFIVLPGVPREMRAIMSETVLPGMGDAEQAIASLTLHTAAIVESGLAQILEPVLEQLEGMEVAFLPDYTGVDIRLTAAAPGSVGATATLHAADILKTALGDYCWGQDAETLNAVVVSRLIDIGQTIAVAESCTGGLLSSLITDIPGSSKVFNGGVIAYSDRIKEHSLGVRQETLKTNGAVSAETAIEMANGIRNQYGTDWGVSTTGISGPSGGSIAKPVGLIYIAIASEKKQKVERLNLIPQRHEHKRASAIWALNLLRKELPVHA